MMYVLFGPPGVGKTYIGSLLSQKLKIQFLDADEMISMNETYLLRSGRYDQLARGNFLVKLRLKIETLSNKYKNLVVAEAFTKEQNRRDFIKNFKKNICFIRVLAPRLVAKKRTIGRLTKQNHVITEELFDFFWQICEKPKIKHKLLNNYRVSDDKIISKFQTFIIK